MEGYFQALDYINKDVTAHSKVQPGQFFHEFGSRGQIAKMLYKDSFQRLSISL
jgi:hypothetical protein